MRRRHVPDNITPRGGCRVSHATLRLVGLSREGTSHWLTKNHFGSCGGSTCITRRPHYWCHDCGSGARCRVSILTTSAVHAGEEISSDSSDQELEDLHLLSGETTSMEAGLIGGCHRETAKEHDLYTHDVLFGRPDFDSLVNEEVTRLSSLQDASTHNTRRYSISTLNVVTCGPKSMMIAVRDGCETARKISSQRRCESSSQKFTAARDRTTSECGRLVDAFRVTEHRMPLKRVKRRMIATI